MFWQSFICGIGGALGASIVFLAVIVESLELTRQSVVELRRRNDLSESQHTILWRIVESLDAQTK